jgi:hypothetical protein
VWTSAAHPSARKPITVARGHLLGRVLRLQRLDLVPAMAGFEALLASSGPWLGAFDFPFGLPRAFVDAQSLGRTADEVITTLHQRCPTRMAFRALVDAWGNTRPAGQRLVHRVADTALPGLSSTSPLQTRYVPVGFMYYEGFSRLVAAGVHAPGLRCGDTQRVALEGYPGLLAHELIARRSYKNDAGTERLGWQPHDFQRRGLAGHGRGRSGLLHATTGSGKTYAVWMGALARQRLARRSRRRACRCCG